MLQNLDRLKVFYHVYSSGGVARAAEILNVSQSAVSQTLQKLEQEINSPLFVRLHKRLVPTSAGGRLYTLVQPFMNQLDSYLKDLGTSKDYPMGELRVGAPPELGKTYFPAIVAGFREKYREVTFVLEFGTPDRLLPLLEGGRIDFALVDVFLTKQSGGDSLDIFHFNPVLEEEVILACSREYHDNNIMGVYSYEVISKQNFIGYQKNQQTIRKWFKHHFRKSAVQINDVVVVDSHDAVIGSITQNLGLGIIASHQVQTEIEKGTIVPISTKRSQMVNPIALVHLQDKIPTLTEKVFAQYLVEQISTMVGDSSKGMKVVLP